MTQKPPCDEGYHSAFEGIGGEADRFRYKQGKWVPQISPHMNTKYERASYPFETRKDSYYYLLGNFHNAPPFLIPLPPKI